MFGHIFFLKTCLVSLVLAQLVENTLKIVLVQGSFVCPGCFLFLYTFEDNFLTISVAIPLGFLWEIALNYVNCFKENSCYNINPTIPRAWKAFPFSDV